MMLQTLRHITGSCDNSSSFRQVDNVSGMFARGACSLAALLLVLVPGVARAVETEFWQPYHLPDPAAYLLASCDDDGLPSGTAKVAKVERQGNVAAVEGKFGRAVRLDGKSAVRLDATEIFAGGNVSIEAWVKLDRYPAKRAYVLSRPGKVDAQPAFNPEADVTKGFGLFIDQEGALHLETTNLAYGATVLTSSKPGVVPLGQWVHVAGIGDAFPISFRRLYVDGREVGAEAITWGKGLTVQGEEERQTAPIYLGNNAAGDRGLQGAIDQVRIHARIAKFWPNEDEAWTKMNRPGEVPAGPPHFLAEHEPILYLPLDNNLAAQGKLEGLEVRGGEQFAEGVCGRALRGRLELRAAKLLDLNEGTISFWLRPGGVNNYSDWNYSFLGGPFTLYILNSPGLAFKPLSLYFPKPSGELQFLKAGEFETRPGRWYHLLVTWKGDEVAVFADGQPGGRSFGAPLARDPKNTACAQLSLSAPESLIDEVCVYHKALSPEEAANAFYCYRDRTKLVAAVPRCLRVRAQYFPSENRIDYRLMPETEGIKRVILRLRSPEGKTLLEKMVGAAEFNGGLQVPDLPNGRYTLATFGIDASGREQPGGEFHFRRHRFAWEKNRLGVVNEVYAPFQPIEVEGNRASIVGRQYTFNGWGLLDAVESAGEAVLAAPMTARYTTAAGEGRWDASGGKFASKQPNLAVFEAEAQGPAVAVKTRSTLEIDGCVRVEMSLLPGRVPARIERLWLDIPLRAGQARLMHAVTAGLRQNYAGVVPAGEGVIWDGSKAHQYQPWLNAFVPYVWLGTPLRGLAWFAENDRGWLTEKTHAGRIQEIVREKDRVTLRVYLVNQPATLTERRDLVFGLQASPTKPMPIDWRACLPHAPGGLAVVPWGGLDCASQSPLNDDWRIADKILEPRQGRPFDAAWFQQFAAERRPPDVHGTWPWLDAVAHFASRAKDVGPKRPLAVYQEEMRGCPARPEWAVFQDEWTTEPHRYQRDDLPDRVFQRGYETLAEPQTITFPRSYQDFGCSIAEEWLRRGVSLYWDNTYPYASSNTRTTAAYQAEDGRVQPCMILWNHREYGKRVWHQLQSWRRQRPEPLEFTLHMTNTLLLPVHTWGTVNLDHEFGSKRPFSPEWLQTETIGLQVGNLPLSLYAVSGSENEVVQSLSAAERERIEWGLRAVHEIQRQGPSEKLLADFGYGGDEVQVHNYWAARPLLRVEPAEVKWLALRKSKTGEILLVLASWSQQPVTARVAFDQGAKRVSMGRVVDVESGAEVAKDADGDFSAAISAPWGNRVVRWTAAAESAP